MGEGESVFSFTLLVTLALQSLRKDKGRDSGQSRSETETRSDRTNKSSVSFLVSARDKCRVDWDVTLVQGPTGQVCPDWRDFSQRVLERRGRSYQK